MVAVLPVVDTNLFVRHVRQDHPAHSLRASAYIAQIEAGELTAKTNELVISEIVYVLQSFYRMRKSDIASVLLPIIALSQLKIPNKARLRKTLDWYARYNVSFIDAYLAVLTEEQKLPGVVSFDTNYRKLPNIRRIEP